MVQFTGEAFTSGVEELEREGVKLRVYGVAKMTVAAVLLLADRKFLCALCAVAAQAELDRRVDAAAVEALDAVPDLPDAGRLDVQLARIDLGALVDDGDRGEVLGDAAAGDDRGEHDGVRRW